MRKELKKKMMITSIVTALPILVGLALWNQLPEQMAIHFGRGGEANGWSSKGFAVIGLPLILVALNIICMVVTETDPRRAKYPEKMMKLVYWICPVASWIGSMSIYGNAMGYDLSNMELWVNLLLGVVFIVIGNYLPKIKQNYYLGIKLPWTYASEANWNKTHRLGGKVWVLGGILFILNTFLKVKGAEIVLIIVMILVPTVYSYLYSREEQKKGSES